MAVQDPSDERKASSDEFHLKEFELLRKANDTAEDRLVTIIQYLLLFSAVVYTFLLNRSTALPKPAMAIWSLPSIASVLVILVLRGNLGNIKLMHKYFRKLECHYDESKFGWEHFKETERGKPGSPTEDLVKLISTVIVILNVVACIAGIFFELSKSVLLPLG